MRLRAFLTTLVTLIIGRAVFDILVVDYGTAIQSSFVSSDAWDFIGDGTVFGFSVAVLTAVAIAILAHIALTRSRPGWHILAVGGSRRSAFNSGINVKRTVFMTYVISGLCCGLAGFLFACRLSGAGPGTGAGLEILALTAAVVGGNSLGGGRGSIVKGAMGAIIVLVMTNGLIRLGFGTGFNQMVLGLLLAVAVVLDIRWLKNRDKVLNELYVAPIHHRMGETQSALPASGTPYALNDRLAEDRIYRPRRDRRAGGRDPRPRRPSLLRHAPRRDRARSSRPTTNAPRCSRIPAASRSASPSTGRQPPLLRRRHGTLCDLQVRRGDQALRRDPPHLDLDRRRRAAARSQRLRRRAGRPHLLHRFHHALRRARMGGGFDREPADRPPAVLRPEDRQDDDRSSTATATPMACASPMTAMSLFMAESWACRVHRYWFDGPKKGQVECVIKDMPGYPDNINRASDGTYWMAWLGMRTPSFDLALRSPGMRKRMTRRLPQPTNGCSPTSTPAAW